MRQSLRSSALSLVLWPVLVFSQVPLAFDVASIKAAVTSPDGSYVLGRSRETPGGVDYRSISLYSLILKAYRIEPYQLSAPVLGQERWDVVARTPAGATVDQIPAMLQSLLAERFKLQVHRDSKEMQAYALIVAKGGAKLKEVSGPATAIGGSRSPEGGTRWTGRVPVSRLAQALSITMQVPVVDLTGLAGTYEIQFDVAPENGGSAGGGGSLDAESVARAASLPGPSLSQAMEKALGLKLDPRKLKIERLVVDHVERVPAGN